MVFLNKNKNKNKNKSKSPEDQTNFFVSSASLNTLNRLFSNDLQEKESAFDEIIIKKITTWDDSTVIRLMDHLNCIGKKNTISSISQKIDQVTDVILEYVCQKDNARLTAKTFQFLGQLVKIELWNEAVDIQQNRQKAIQSLLLKLTTTACTTEDVANTLWGIGKLVEAGLLSDALSSYTSCIDGLLRRLNNLATLSDCVLIIKALWSTSKLILLLPHLNKNQGLFDPLFKLIDVQVIDDRALQQLISASYLLSNKVGQTKTKDLIQVCQPKSALSQKVIKKNIPAYVDKVEVEAFIHGYFVDLFLPDYRLIIEVDGKKTHSGGQKCRDLFRDTVFKGEGYQIIRLDADDFFNSTKCKEHSLLVDEAIKHGVSSKLSLARSNSDSPTCVIQKESAAEATKLSWESNRHTFFNGSSQLGLNVNAAIFVPHSKAAVGLNASELEVTH